jgi:triacylglycerol lipase
MFKNCSRGKMKLTVKTAFAVMLLACTSSLFASNGGSKPLEGSYPIVLSHGILGFDDSKGLLNGLVKYWGGMDDYLRSKGAAVYTPGTTAMQSIEDRAEDQAALVKSWMASINASKVHVLAHSQGGLVTRSMITNYSMDKKVSTLTTINTPHYGTPTADIALAVIPNWLEPHVGTVLNWFGSVLFTDDNQDIIAMAESLTVATGKVFNRETPNDSDVTYFSVGSYMYENFFVHPLMSLVCPITAIGGPFYGLGTYNDGVVPYNSMKWGKWKGRPSFGHISGIDHLQATNSDMSPKGYYDVEGFYLDMAVNAKNNQ